MISATGSFRGVEATATDAGWASGDMDLAESLNRGWPVTGGEAGHPVLRAFYAAIKDLGGKVIRADDAPPYPPARKYSESDLPGDEEAAFASDANLPAVLDLPPAFDTFAERQRRTEGQVWSVGKNWYTKKGGKIRRAADPSNAKAPGVAQAGRSGKKTPTDPSKVHDAVKAILARPESLDDPKAEAELARHISGLGIKDARALAAKLESGVKDRSIAGLAKKLAADAIAKAKAKGAAKPEPEKLPPAPESGKTDVSLGRPEADAIAALTPGRIAVSGDEAATIKDYTTLSGDVLNRKLASGEKLSAKDRALLGKMSAMMDRVKPFDRPVKTYRTKAPRTAEQTRSLLASLEKSIASGEPIRRPGFLSTSTTNSWGEGEGGRDPGTFHWHINATRGLDLSEHSKYPDEAELLLPQNAGLRITGVRKEGGIYIVEADQVDDGRGAAPEPVKAEKRGKAK